MTGGGDKRDELIADANPAARLNAMKLHHHNCCLAALFKLEVGQVKDIQGSGP